MSNNKVLLTDCDGVLLDWLSGFNRFIRHHKNIKPDTHIPVSWEISEWLKVSKYESDNLIREFNSDSWEFGTLDVLSDAKKGLTLFKEDGYDITVITSVSKKSSAHKIRRVNLFHHFGDIFNDVICLDFGESKLDTLKKFPKGSIWVEDNLKQAGYGVEVGHKVFLMSHIHNESFDLPEQITRVPNWSRIYDHVLFSK